MSFAPQARKLADYRVRISYLADDITFYLAEHELTRLWRTRARSTSRQHYRVSHRFLGFIEPKRITNRGCDEPLMSASRCRGVGWPSSSAKLCQRTAIRTDTRSSRQRLRPNMGT